MRVQSGLIRLKGLNLRVSTGYFNLELGLKRLQFRDKLFCILQLSSKTINLAILCQLELFDFPL